MIAFYVMYRYGATLNHRYTRRMVFYFANISIAVSSITITIFMFSTPDTFVEKIYMLLFFAGQLPPVLFLGYYLNKYFSSSLEVNSKQDAHNIFISNYQLSKREWQIVEKICEGLTNGQIGDSLFISLQTVKDHVHRIYKKTGVKNRVQLVNMISSLKRE
jgi:DNA-binding NarL/FixJ family response regulator